MWLEDGDVATLITDAPSDPKAFHIAAAYGVTIRPQDVGFDPEGEPSDWRLTGWLALPRERGLFLFTRANATTQPRESAIRMLALCETDDGA